MSSKGYTGTPHLRCGSLSYDPGANGITLQVAVKIPTDIPGNTAARMLLVAEDQQNNGNEGAALYCKRLSSTSYRFGLGWWAYSARVGHVFTESSYSDLSYTPGSDGWIYVQVHAGTDRLASVRVNKSSVSTGDNTYYFPTSPTVWERLTFGKCSKTTSNRPSSTDLIAEAAMWLEELSTSDLDDLADYDDATSYGTTIEVYVAIDTDTDGTWPDHSGNSNTVTELGAVLYDSDHPEAISGTTDGAGSATGTATAAAVGISTHAASGTASGAATATATGEALQTLEGAGAASGVATATAAGSSRSTSPRQRTGSA